MNLLRHINLSVPNRYVARRRRPQLEAVPYANMLRDTPLTQSTRIMNLIANEVIFMCPWSEFTTIALFICRYKLNKCLKVFVYIDHIV